MIDDWKVKPKIEDFPKNHPLHHECHGMNNVKKHFGEGHACGSQRKLPRIDSWKHPGIYMIQDKAANATVMGTGYRKNTQKKLDTMN